LDGSYLMRQLTGMSHETYHRIAQYGFLIVILVLQVPVVRRLLTDVTHASWVMIATVFGLGG
jgi:hypothetical protein